LRFDLQYCSCKETKEDLKNWKIFKAAGASTVLKKYFLIYLKNSKLASLCWNKLCRDSLALVMGRGQKKVGLVWVGSAIYSLIGFGKFPLKCQIFQFFSLRVKKISWLGQKVLRSKAGWPHIYCGSKAKRRK